MKNALESDLNRIGARIFALSAAGLLAAAFFGVFERIMAAFSSGTVMPGEAVQISLAALESEPVILALPILAALPFTTAFLDDYSSRYVLSSLPRSGKRNYVASKCLITGLSGGLALLLGAAATVGVLELLIQPLESAPAYWEDTSEFDVARQAAFLDLMGRFLLLFLSGALWALVGACLATLTMSYYVAYASPFVFFYVLVILAERYARGGYMMNPKEWLSPSQNWPGVAGTAVFVGELVGILGVLYSILLNRRLKDV